MGEGAAPGGRALTAPAAARGCGALAPRAGAAAAVLAALGLAVAAAPGPPAASPGQPSAAPSDPAARGVLSYRLEAPDGVPGDARVVLEPDRAGPWVVTATWSGRGLASLRVEDDGGRTLARRTAPSPLVLEIPVAAPGGDAPTPSRYVVRFAPLTARGPLAGELRIAPPSAGPPPERPAGPAAPASGRPVHEGPGKCLGATRGDAAEERALLALADALEAAPPDAVVWCSGWAARLGRAAADPGRAALDDLWQDLRQDPAPAPRLDAAFRQVLAALEDLTRRAANPKNAHAAVDRERRAALLDRVACIAPPSSSPSR